MNELRTCHLFAGAGGGLLADLILGHKPIIAVEWDAYACQVLRERAADGWFPGLRVHEGDVRLFDPSEYTGSVDVIHAGFPCQDISVAGKQAGVSEGTRSGLYREVLRIAGVVRPKFLFLENVSAILSNGLGTVLGDLAALGYDSRWCCIRASDVGAPHGRDRWFLLGNAEHARQPAAEVAGGIAPGGNGSQAGAQQAQQPTRPSEQYEAVADTESAGAGCNYGGLRAGLGRVNRRKSAKSEDVADTDSTQCQGNERAERVGTEHADISSAGWWESVADLGGLAYEFSAESLPDQEFQAWWEVEPDIGRTTNDNRNRAAMLKCLGNGQVPLQAATAWRLLGGG